jgi:hypothetical protein
VVGRVRADSLTAQSKPFAQVRIMGPRRCYQLTEVWSSCASGGGGTGSLGGGGTSGGKVSGVPRPGQVSGTSGSVRSGVCGR